MPGSGKSTLGKLLARRLNITFCDTDKLIEKKFNLPLQEILDLYGEERFKLIEEQIITKLILNNTVISTGGSAVYSKNAMEYLASKGIVIFINTDLDTLKTRIKNPTKRGIVLSNGETFEDIYNRRLPLYKQYAEITVNSTMESPYKTIEKLIELLKKQKVIY